MQVGWDEVTYFYFSRFFVVLLFLPSREIVICYLPPPSPSPAHPVSPIHRLTTTTTQVLAQPYPAFRHEAKKGDDFPLQIKEFALLLFHILQRCYFRTPTTPFPPTIPQQTPQHIASQRITSRFPCHMALSFSIHSCLAWPA
jgi:hypothetical protein